MHSFYLLKNIVSSSFISRFRVICVPFFLLCTSYLVLLSLYFVPRTSYSQSVGIFGSTNLGVNNTGAHGNPSAVFDISSTTTGLLIPRMTMAQRDAITSPETSLIIFQTDNTPGYYFNSGTPGAPAWVMLASAASSPWTRVAPNVFLTTGTDNVGIGTTAPFTKFQVAGDNTMTSSVWNAYEGVGLQGGFSLIRTRGTVAAPTAVMSGDILGRINFNGLDNTSDLKDDASIGAVATENFTGTAHGTDMTFHTTIPGTISKTEKMRIAGNGNVGIGTASPSSHLHVFGSSDPHQIMVENSGSNFKTGYTIKTATNEWFIGQEVNAASGFRITDIDASSVRVQIDPGGNVGIGTTSPAEMLDVAGRLRIGALAAPGVTTDKLYNVGGNLFWNGVQLNAAGGTDWTLLGNAGTTDGTHFIGTTDAIPFNIRVNNLKAGRIETDAFAGSNWENSFLGYRSGNSTTTGYSNAAFGTDALYSNITGNSNTAIGTDALYSNTTGFRNTAIGVRVLNANVTASYNTAIGSDALRNNTYGENNVAVGSDALYTQSYTNTNNNWATENVAVGYKAMYSNQPSSSTNGYKNTALGTYSLTNNSTGSGNTVSGYMTFYSNTTGSFNTANGYQTMWNNTIGSANTSLGRSAMYSNKAGSNATAIGTFAMQYVNDQAGAYTNFNVAVGYEALRGSTTAANNTGNSNTALGYQTLLNNTKGGNNVAVGTSSLLNNSNAERNVAVGSEALYTQSFANGVTAWITGNVAMGYRALYNNQPTSSTNAYYNTAIGNEAGLSNTTGLFNTFVGASAGRGNTLGGRNTFVGESAGYNIGGGSNNTFIGEGVGYFAASGDNNTLIGYSAGGSSNPLGNYNTYLGYNARGSASLNNATAIGKNAEATVSNSFILGGTGADAVNVGIGTTAPLATLDITSNGGTVLFPRKSSVGDPGGAVNGMIYYNQNTSKFRAYENGTWVDVIPGAGSGWNLTGNSGTVDGTNFIGTTDDIPFTIKVNNQKAGRIETNSGSGNNFSNTFLGFRTGNSNTTGSENTAIGYTALYSNTTGSENTAIGNYALYSNNTSTSNTASGGYALYYNSTGNNNTANGEYALFSNVAGSNATAVGYRALYYANNTATPFTNFNVAVGYEALRGSATPASNTGNGNAALGYQTLLNNTSGSSNTGSGYRALYSNTSGTENTANGWGALISNTTASYGTAIGTQALYLNTIGAENTAVGYQSLGSNSTGSQNTAIGWGSLYTQSFNNGGSAWSSKNTAVGYQALYNNAPTASSNGIQNTAVGMNSLITNTTGTNNTAIGYAADVTSGTLTNATAIGYNAKVDASNAMVLGGTGADAVNVGIGTTLPLATLDITKDGGTVLFPRKSTGGDPAGAANGMIYYNQNTNKFRVFENGAWTDMVAGAGSSPWSRTAPNTYLTTVSDNVGIGTSNPFRKFHVEIAGSEGLPGDAGNVVINNNDFAAQTASLSIIGGTTGLARLSFGHATVGLRGVIDYENSNNNMVFKTNTVEAMRIDNLGQVGIGGISPAANLHIAANSTNMLWVESALTGPGGDGGELSLLRSRGTLAAPSAIATGDKLGVVSFLGYAGGSGYVGPSASIESIAAENFTGTAIGANLRFFTVAAGTNSKQERVRITHDGNVGIGTTTPLDKLHIQFSGAQKNPGFGGFLHLQGSNHGILMIATNEVNDNWGFQNLNGSNRFRIFTFNDDGSNVNERLVIANSGNVGIGITNPKGKLQVAGDAALGDGTTANEGVVTVFLTNNTGAASVKGEIVIVNPGVNNSFIKTTTPGHTSVIGVVYESGVADGQPCKVAISGIVAVKADAATTRGQHCITGNTTAGAAGSVATPGAGTSIGVWLENVGSGVQGKVLLR